MEYSDSAPRISPELTVSSNAQQARIALGARLRDLRRDAGLTGRALADSAGWQLSKVSKIEHGKQQPSPEDIRVWCAKCDADAHLTDLVATARNIETLWQEWRRTLQDGLKRRQKTSVKLYEETRQFRIYDPSGVVGILQTADYAATILRQAVEFYRVPDDVDQAVASRMDRQKFLREGRGHFSVLMAEASLVMPVGDSQVMRGQLEHLLAVATIPSLSMGIIPMNAPAQFWALHPFIMFDNRLVMVETYSAELRVTHPHELVLYERAFELLRRSAVYGSDARRLIYRAITNLD